MGSSIPSLSLNDRNLHCNVLSCMCKGTSCVLNTKFRLGFFLQIHMCNLYSSQWKVHTQTKSQNNMALQPLALAENFSSENCQQTVIQCFSPLPYSYDENKTFHSPGVKKRFSSRSGVVLDGETYEHYHIHLLSKLFVVSLMVPLNNFCWEWGIGHTFTEFWAESLPDASLQPDFDLMAASK